LRENKIKKTLYIIGSIGLKKSLEKEGGVMARWL
jgi:hypothetical protein